MKVFLLCISVFLVFREAKGQAMSEKQLQTAARLVKNVCQPKFKISNAQLEAIHRGEFTEEKDLMCYMECVLRLGKLMKNNKFDYEGAMKTMHTLPVNRQEPTTITTTKCKDSAVSDDKCVAGFQAYKCLYNDNPDNFFLP